MTTAIAGALLLGERFSWKRAAAGRTSPTLGAQTPKDHSHCVFSVVSLGGVVLIARPASLFGGSGHDPLAFPDDGGLPVPSETHRVVTSEQRLMAIA